MLHLGLHKSSKCPCCSHDALTVLEGCDITTCFCDNCHTSWYFPVDKSESTSSITTSEAEAMESKLNSILSMTLDLDNRFNVTLRTLQTWIDTCGSYADLVRVSGFAACLETLGKLNSGECREALNKAARNWAKVKAV